MSCNSFHVREGAKTPFCLYIYTVGNACMIMHRVWKEIAKWKASERGKIGRAKMWEWYKERIALVGDREDLRG